MTPLRKRVAERLLQAQSNAAILTTFNEVDMSAVMGLRKQYNEKFEKKHGVKLGFMSFFVKATIEALKTFPAVNASIEGTDIVYKNYYDIGVAVSGTRGLVVPVVRDADTQSMADLEKTIADFGRAGEERQADAERPAGRHLHHFQRRHLRLDALHPDFEPAADGHLGHAQHRRAARWCVTESTDARNKPFG